MADIKQQKLVYHLTALENVRRVLAEGLKPRSQLANFQDVADQAIIQKRQVLALENYVPFHWFAKNPFDGNVQTAHKGKPFVLITVHRDFAAKHNWQVIPRHPLANGAIELLDYATGFATIDWDTMNKRDYHDPICKSACMAECLSPGPVPVVHFYQIYVPGIEIERQVLAAATELGITVEVVVNENMFLK